MYTIFEYVLDMSVFFRGFADKNHEYIATPHTACVNILKRNSSEGTAGNYMKL